MKQSAGLLLYRRTENSFEVFLVHPGGPFWKKKDEGAWSIPKGEVEAGHDALLTAMREFEEETGSVVEGPFQPLQPVQQKGGKMVLAWAVEGNIEPATCRSNSFVMTWPPGSGRSVEFPEVDKWEWFSASDAMGKINPAQAGLIEQLHALLTARQDVGGHRKNGS